MQGENPVAESGVTLENTAFPVDPEPVAMRLLLIVILITGSIAGYAIVNSLFPGASLNFIALGLGILIGGTLMWGSEKLLKPNWPATRFVEVTPQSVRMTRRGQTEHSIDPTQHVNVLAWHFEVSKRAHVPKGWYVVALALEQDDHYIPVYTFVPPDDFNQWNRDQTFRKLEKLDKKAEDGRGDLRLAGEQRRLRMGEGARVFHGAEMTQEHFKVYIESLQQHFPAWMPSIPEL